MSNQSEKRNGVDPIQLIVKIEGPKVGEAKIAASDLAEIISRTQQAIKRIGQVLYGEDSRGQGRKKREIEQLCALYVTGLEKGSAVPRMEIAPQPPQLELFGYIGEESIKSFISGMEQVTITSPKPSEPPNGFDTGVLQAIDALGKVLDHGIDTITFHTENGKKSKYASYNTTARNNVRELLGRPVDLGQSTKAGRLETLNGHGKLTGKLWEPGETSAWLCHFKEEHLELLPEAWMHNVKLIGKAIVGEGKEKILQVESIIVISEEIESEGRGKEAFPFWKSLTTEELIEIQGVAPVSNLDELSALWPADDDPDELLNFILDERDKRRKLSGSAGVEP